MNAVEQSGTSQARAEPPLGPDRSLVVKLSGDWRLGQQVPSAGDLRERIDSESGLSHLGFDTQNFSRTLAENLSVLLGTEEVVVLPWSRSIPLDHHLVMSVIRFEGRPGGNVELISRWGFLVGEDKTLVDVQKSSISEPTDGSTYEALVAAHSRALLDLSREIADAISAIPGS